jgi:hypothetical protein
MVSTCCKWAQQCEATFQPMRTEKLQTIIHNRKIPLLLINETFLAFSRTIIPN